MPRRFLLAAYDVSEPRRLQQALQVLKGFSTGGQKSVFECFLSEAENSELHRAIAAVIEPHEDRFLTVNAEAGPFTRALGIAVMPEDPPYFYVG